MIGRCPQTHCSSARSVLVARSVPLPASNGGWRKRRARAFAACFCRTGRRAARILRGSGWRESVSSPGVLPPDIGVVVVAAGAGVRAGPGEPKQFRPILGVPMLLRALRPFTSHPEVRQVIIVLPPGYADRPPEWLGKLRGDSVGLVAGGAQRADSGRAGLPALRSGTAGGTLTDPPPPLPGGGHTPPRSS